MSDAEAKPEAGTVRAEMQINAPVEAVWKALTDAEELSRWFPLQARVTPGVGGKVWASWGAPWEGEGTIEVWEPNQLLRITSPAMGGGGAVVTDYILESRGGKTLVRVVQSGFHCGAQWDEEFVEGTRRGWQFELRGLRHYLEHHRGTPRRVAWARAEFSIPLEDAWNRLLGPQGLVAEGSLAAAREWDRYRIRAATGDLFEGVVHICNPPQDLAATVHGLNNAYLRLRLDQFSGKREANVWLSTYGVPQADVDAFRERWMALLQKLLA